MRISATMVLSVSFLGLLVTGILMYITPYDFFTSSLHVWSALLVILSICLHFKNNWKPYKSYFKKQSGKRAFSAIIVVIVVVMVGLLFDRAPFTSLPIFGDQLRKSASVATDSFVSIDVSHDHKGNKLSLFAKAGADYESEKKSILGGLITYTSTPQMAVWVETLEGEYVKTLYLTGKLANSSFRNSDFSDEVVRRPEALPHWMHKRNVKASDGLLPPDPDNNEFDGITAATPLGSHELTMALGVLDKYRLKIEVNRTYDFNEYYSKDRFPDDAIYSGNGSSGQPSLIYEAVINTKENGRYLLDLIGHGHHSGKNGELYSDLKNITTAKNLFDFFMVNVLVSK
ncbi:DUF4405 domain-containing protein [Teredinibacter waterburyi]|uniref:DUF4405 domain-containing protein n=1 Tax=Teredinibacter waterburyi TaxID=1500538 RepID=UPI001FE5AF4E|nr:DUF4405 domain-containing protein [Teredinibacter waterburyi]